MKIGCNKYAKMESYKKIYNSNCALKTENTPQKPINPTDNSGLCAKTALLRILF